MDEVPDGGGIHASREDPTRAAAAMARLLTVMWRLRGPDGCPWDREQTLESLQPFLVEETCELLEALVSGDADRHADELGDVLLQVVFQCCIRTEQGRFGLADVVERLTDKLVRRHPHVFGTVEVRDSAEVVRNWQAIKRTEPDGAGRDSALDGIPRILPALQLAQKTQKKASAAGMDWSDRDPVARKVEEEWAELREAMRGTDANAVGHEVGDLLFSVVNLCRFLGVDAESALRAGTARFARRFRAVEARVQASGRCMSACDLHELDAHWETAKRAEVP